MAGCIMWRGFLCIGRALYLDNGVCDLLPDTENKKEDTLLAPTLR